FLCPKPSTICRRSAKPCCCRCADPTTIGVVARRRANNRPQLSGPAPQAWPAPGSLLFGCVEEYFFLARLAAAHFAAYAAAGQNEDAVAHAQDLLNLGGDEDDGGVFFEHVVHCVVNVNFGGGVYATRGLVHNVDARTVHEPAANHNFL